MFSRKKMACALAIAGISLFAMSPVLAGASPADGDGIAAEIVSDGTENGGSDSSVNTPKEPSTQGTNTVSKPEAAKPESPPPETAAPETTTPEEPAPKPEAAPPEETTPNPTPETTPPDETTPDNPTPEVTPPDDGTPTEPAPEVTPPDEETPTEPTPEVTPPEETPTDPEPEVTPPEETPAEPAPEVTPQPDNPTEPENNNTGSGHTSGNSATTGSIFIGQQIVMPPSLFTKVDKVFAIVNIHEILTVLNVREGKSDEDRIVGTLNHNAVCYILADADQEWVYIESGTVRGFVLAKYLVTGETADAYVEAHGEENLELAELVIPAAENAAYRYTTTTAQDGMGSAIRMAMIEYAQQFLGNPYVWGGTSLTNGADCSGFTQGIYAQFGYSIPRVSRDQAEYGMKIPVSEALPGDMIFYARNGVVYHVVMYIGDGKVIHASSPSVGIVITGINYNNAVWATRVIQETDTLAAAATVADGSVAAGQTAPTLAASATQGTHLGTFKLTAYCNCAKCCGKWAGGPTASGTAPTEGRTVAMAGVPFGTKLNIGGQIFTVEDRGTPYGHVDIFMTDHDRCNVFGVQYAEVYQVQ